MASPKEYYIQNGDEAPFTVDAKKFESKKDGFYQQYPDATVYELADYDPTKTYSGDETFNVWMDGDERAASVSYAKFNEKKDAFFQQYPDARVRVATPLRAGGRDLVQERADREELNRLRQQRAEAQQGYRQALQYQKENDWNINDEDMDYAKVSETAGVVGNAKSRLNEIEDAIYNNPEYQRTQKALVNRLNGEKDRIAKEIKDYESSNPRAARAYYEQKNVQGLPPTQRNILMSGSEQDAGFNDKRDYLAGTQYWINKAAQVANAPSKYDDKKTGTGNFVRAMRDDWTAIEPMVELLRSSNEDPKLLTTFMEIQKNEGKDANIFALAQDKNSMQYLSPEQRGLVNAYLTYTATQAQRADDLSIGYKAGQSFINSLGFMKDFLVSAGFGNAIAKGSVQGLNKAIARKAVDMGLKGTKRTLVEAPAKFLAGTMEGLVKTAVTSPAMPSFWNMVTDNMTQLNDLGQVDLSGQALMRYIGDAAIEVFSENAGKGIEEMIAAPFRGAGMALDKIGFGEWSRAIHSAPTMKILRDSGFNNIGELGEEWYGALLRQITGIDNEALKDQFNWENQLTTIASFAPMMLFGVGSSSAQFKAAKRRMDKKADELATILTVSGYDKDTIDNILDLTQVENPTDLAKQLAPVIQQVTADNGNAGEAARAVCEYAKAVAQYKTFAGVSDIDMQSRRDEMRDQIAQSVQNDKWIHHTQTPAELDGEPVEMQTVRVLTDAGGNRIYVTAEDDVDVVGVTESGEAFHMSKVDLSNQVKDGNMTDTGEMSLQNYIDMRLAAVKDEQQRESDAIFTQRQISSMRDNLAVGQTINTGTVESPATGTVVGVSDDGVIIQHEDGTATEYNWEEMGNMLNTPIVQPSQEEVENEQVQAITDNQDAADRLQQNTGKIFTIGDEQLTIVSAKVDGDNIRIALRDANGDKTNDLVVSAEQAEKDILSQFNAPQQQTEETKTETIEDETPTEQTTDRPQTPLDIHGNPMPMRTNAAGERVVDEKALWDNDPAAWAAFNDANPAARMSSVEFIQAKQKELSSQIATLNEEYDKEYTTTMDGDKLDAIQAKIAPLQERYNAMQAILDENKVKEEAAKVEVEPAPVGEETKGVKTEEAVQEETPVGSEVAAEYLLSGEGVVQSPSYLLTAYEGLFPKAAEAIRKVKEQFKDKLASFATIEDYVQSNERQEIDNEISSAIEQAYGKDGVEVFSRLKEYPTGTPYKIGQQFAKELEPLEANIQQGEQNVPENPVPEEATPFEQKVQQIKEWLGKRADDESIIFTDAEGAEKALREGNAKESDIRALVKDKPDGFYFKGNIYIITDNATDKEQVRKTYLHEKQHQLRAKGDQKVQEIIDNLTKAFSVDKMHKMLRILSGTTFYDKYTDSAVLADELVAFSMENCIAGNSGIRTLSKKLGRYANISYISNITNLLQYEQSLFNPGRQGSVNAGQLDAGRGAVDAAENAGGTGQVGQEGTRPAGTGERGVTEEVVQEVALNAEGGIDTGDSNQPVSFSVSSHVEGAGLELQENDGKGNVAFVAPDGTVYNYKNLLSVEDLKRNTLSPMYFIMNDADLLHKGDRKWPAKAAVLWQKYCDMLNAYLVVGRASKGIPGYDRVSDKWQWIAETIYKTVAINSDSQYSFSLDITRVCKKNEAIINALCAMQLRLGYGITPGQVMDLYIASNKRGYEVPCPVCYAFTRYIRNGQYATIMINGQNTYGQKMKEFGDPAKMSEEQKQAAIDYWLDEYKKVRQWNNEHRKEIDAAKEVITEAYDEIDRISEILSNPKSKLTKEQKTALNKKAKAVDKNYQDALKVVTQSSLDSWMKQFILKGISDKDGSPIDRSKVSLWEDSWQGYPEEMALDLRQTATVLDKYPAIQRFRNTRGAGAGKEVTFAANNNIGDVILAVGSDDATKALAQPDRTLTDEERAVLEAEENGKLKLGVKNLYVKASRTKDPVKRAALLADAWKGFQRAALYARRQTLRGGQRMWSWSDNIEKLAPDVFMNLLQMEVLDGGLQSYSKQLEGINLVAQMGGYVNGSLMGDGVGYVEVSEDQIENIDGALFLKGEREDLGTDENGNVVYKALEPVFFDEKTGKYYSLRFDSKIGVNPYGMKAEDGHHLKGLFELNQTLDKAGNIMVGVNDIHVRACMADDRIFFIIPWHASGANNHILSQMYRVLDRSLEREQMHDYTPEQEEKRYDQKTAVPQEVVDFWKYHYENKGKYSDKAGKDFPCYKEIESGNGEGSLSEDQKEYRKLRDGIFLGVSQDGKTELVENVPEYWDKIKNDAFLYQTWKMVRSVVGEEGMTAGDCKYIYPYEYWDTSSTFSTADVNGARYLEYCRRLGFKPKFCGQFKAKEDAGNFVDDKGYWKVLIDRRMYDINGRYQSILPIAIEGSDNAEGFDTRMVDPAWTKENFPVTRVADLTETEAIVDDAIEYRQKVSGRDTEEAGYGMDKDKAISQFNQSKEADKKASEEVRKANKAAASFRVTSRNEEQKKELFDAAKEVMGTTTNMNVAGYILPDGTKLDFSGTKFGAPKDGRRHVDHREIDNYLFDKGEENENLRTNMVDFMAQGAIRYQPESNGIDMIVAPTKEQKDVLRSLFYSKRGEIIFETTDQNGDNVGYAEYDEGTSPSRIMKDIDKYFNDGVMPEGNTMFRVAEEPTNNVGVMFRAVTDKEELDRLNSEPTITMYCSMTLLNPEETNPSKYELLPVKSAKVNGKTREVSRISQWEVSEEDSEARKANGKFDLKDFENTAVANVNYNPYFHLSDSMMNDQFTGAYGKPNTVVVEMKVPASELASGYHADGAANSVGMLPWHSGTVNSQLPKEQQRNVMLSRWRMPVRVVPNTEVAQFIADKLKGTDIEMPWNLVTPGVLAELDKLGVKTGNESAGLSKKVQRPQESVSFRASDYSLGELVQMPVDELKEVADKANVHNIKRLITKLKGLRNEQNKDDIDARIQALKEVIKNPAREKALTDLGVKRGESFDFGKYAEIFHKLNTDEQNAFIFDRIGKVAKELGITYTFDNIKEGGYFMIGGKNAEVVISADAPYLRGGNRVAQTMLHELIHSVTTTSLRMYNLYNGQLRGNEKAIEFYNKFTDEQKAALEDITNVFKSIKLLPEFKEEYGTKSADEMLAELANPVFRAKLRARNLWQRIIDGIKRFVAPYLRNEEGVEKINSYDALLSRLDALIRDFPVDTFEAFAGQRVNRQALNEVRFRAANANQAMFVSNAMQAVEGLDMNKATGEQWIKAIQGRGGLKAGEDKWLGLSEWLQGKDKVTKDEILDFIDENKIRIEEQRYGEDVSASSIKDEMATDLVGGKSLDELQQEVDADAESADRFDREREDDEFSLDDYLMSCMTDRYGDDFATAYYIMDGQVEYNNNPWDMEDEEEDLIANYDGARPINDTRLNYVTGGLENKREIALTVPTIDPWNEFDDVHFGDAGDGRAVAWVRFGETTVNAKAKKDNKAVDNFLMQMREKYSAAEGEETDHMNEEEIAALQQLTATAIDSEENGGGQRVLIIDEVQSKRHQEGRDKGYADNSEIVAAEKRKEEALKEKEAFMESMWAKYGYAYWNDKMNSDELNEWKRVCNNFDSASWHYNRTIEKPQRGVAPAPFEKNWQELAMKRMLRLAAEEGYDVLAWTNGEMQAERYNLGAVVNSIMCEGVNKNGTRDFSFDLVNTDDFAVKVDAEGKIIGRTDAFNNETELGELEGKYLVDVIGKELAVKAMTLNHYEKIEGDGLRFGGEGMKGFYDRMLPSFMDKYCKKWGTSTHDISLPGLQNENGWHAVDVTPEMKESVMEGQVMFRVDEKSMKKYMTPDEISIYENGDTEEVYSVVNAAERRIEELDSEAYNKIASMLGLKPNMSRSQYKKGTTDTGESYEIRLSKHVANADNFSIFNDDREPIDNILSIVVDELFDERSQRFLPLESDNARQIIIKPSEMEQKDYETLDFGIANYQRDGSLKWSNTFTRYRVTDSTQRMATDSGIDYNTSLGGKRFAANDTARKCNVPVEFVSREQMPKGYDKAQGAWVNGKILICLENNPDTTEAAKTVLHEAIGHNGLRRLVGNENMAAFCQELFRKLPASRRAIIENAASRHGWNIAEATEEYLATMAENFNLDKDTNESFWQTVRQALRDLLAKIGIELPLSESDCRWILWNSYNANRYSDVLNMAKRQVLANKLGFSLPVQKMRQEARDQVRFRVEQEQEAVDSARLYNRSLTLWNTMLRESWVDMYTSVEKLIDAIEKESGKAAKSFEDIRLALNRQSSKGYEAIKSWSRKFFMPMAEAVKDICNDLHVSSFNVERYMMLKHGLERNEIFAKRDAREYYRSIYYAEVQRINNNENLTDEEKDEAKANAKALLDSQYLAIEDGVDAKYLENRERDYSGLTGMYSKYDKFEPFNPAVESEEEFQKRARKARHPMYKTVAETEKAAAEEVAAFESRAGKDLIDNLWNKVNRANKATLKHQYDSNMISKDRYESLRDMFKYYIPLRGFEEKTAEDMYTYYTKSYENDFTPPLFNAKGRKTAADHPIGYIGAQASSAIAQDVKNESKLALYYFLSNRPNSLAFVSDIWYEKQADKDGKTHLVPVYPPLNEDLNSEDAKAAYQEWEYNMKEKEKAGLAVKGNKKLNMDWVVNTSKADKASHIIKVKVLGENKMIIINGNPRAAQAINGELNVETSADYSQFFGKILRYLAGVNTSLNPEFWMSNLQRDLLLSMVSEMTKDQGKAFARNLAKAVKTYEYMKAHERGTLGDSYEEQAYREFVENGGVTGYTTLIGNDLWEAELLKVTGEERDLLQSAAAAFKPFTDFGESIEQMVRFAAFLTAKEEGKDVRECVAAAKEISVNFNRKGSGKSLSWKDTERLRKSNGKKLNDTERAMVMALSWIPAFGRRSYMFFNAAVQGLNTVYKMFKANPKKAGLAAVAFLAAGALNAALHAALDGDDDKYLDIPDFTRRTNLMAGGKGLYFKWALPQEMRVFYGLGDMAVTYGMGRYPHKNFVEDALNAALDVAPVNPTEGIRALVPSVLVPFVEIAMNKDFKGMPIYKEAPYMSEEERDRTPEYQMVYRDANGLLVNMSELLNLATGGDYTTAGKININPAKVQHVLESATGGVGTTLMKAYENSIGAIIDKEVKWNRFPFVSRLLYVADERTRNSYINDLFKYYSAEAEHIETIIDKAVKKGDLDTIEKRVGDKQMQIYSIAKPYMKRDRQYGKLINSTDSKEERRQLIQEQEAIRQEMVKELTQIDK